MRNSTKLGKVSRSPPHPVFLMSLSHTISTGLNTNSNGILENRYRNTPRHLNKRESLKIIIKNLKKRVRLL